MKSANMKRLEVRTNCRNTSRRSSKSSRNRIYSAQDEINDIEMLMMQLHAVPPVMTRRASNLAITHNQSMSGMVLQSTSIKSIRPVPEPSSRKRARSADVSKARNAQKLTQTKNKRREESEQSDNESDPTNVDCHLHLSCINNPGYTPNTQYDLLNETQRLLLGCLPRGTSVTIHDIPAYRQESSTRSSQTVVCDDQPIDWDAEKKRGTSLSFESTNSVEYYVGEYLEEKKREKVELAKLEKIQELTRKIKKAEQRKRIKDHMKKRLIRDAERIRRIQEEDEAYEIAVYDSFTIDEEGEDGNRGSKILEALPTRGMPNEGFDNVTAYAEMYFIES